MPGKIKIFGSALFLLLSLIVEIKAQAPVGQFTDRVALENNDTLLLDRKLSSWWFGINAGGNFNTYFDKLNIPWNPQRPVDSSNILFEYPNANGLGLFAGLHGEWLPPESYWGFMLDIILLDYRHVVAETDLITDTVFVPKPGRYQNRNSFTYVTISPSARYNFPIENLYAFAGLDLEIVSSVDSRKITKFENSGQIAQDFIIKFSDVKSRIGFHIGAGYDIFIADFQHRMRAYFCPFISFTGGSTILKDFNSSWNTVMGRFGFNVKLEFDDITPDTLLYVPIEHPEQPYIASIQEPKNVEFPGFVETNPLPANKIAYMEKPEIVEEISEKLLPKPKEDKSKEKLQIVPGKIETFNYATTADVELDDAAKSYLDKLAEYMKNNPSFEVRIIGHSDNTGTFEQNQRRSQMRVDNIVNYLARKGIPRGRMLPRARGAVEPIASNNTAAGRRANRRVEITINEK